jgi:hypothetical protein
VQIASNTLAMAATEVTMPKMSVMRVSASMDEGLVSMAEVVAEVDGDVVSACSDEDEVGAVAIPQSTCTVPGVLGPPVTVKKSGAWATE